MTATPGCQSLDRFVGIRVLEDLRVMGYPVERLAEGHVDARPDGALVKVRLAVGLTCGQP